MVTIPVGGRSFTQTVTAQMPAERSGSGRRMTVIGCDRSRAFM
jgi:hypothetical protein